MENLDKNFDLKVMMEFRKELHCKKCDCFPRPDVKLMRCVSCTKLLCSKCCDGGTVCPLCQYKSKSPKIPTLILQSELMKAIPVFKTQSIVGTELFLFNSHSVHVRERNFGHFSMEIRS